MPLSEQAWQPWPGVQIRHRAWPSEAAVETAVETAASADDDTASTLAERRRLAALARPADRARFVAARGGLRALLADELGLPPMAFTIEAEPQGRPRLAGPAAVTDARCLSLAHSGRHVLCACSAAGALGVDVEVVREASELAGVAAQICTASELAAMAELRGPAWLDAFYRRWVAKEAWLKARGVGLRGDPRGAEVDLSGPRARLAGEAAGAALIELDVGRDARAAAVLLLARAAREARDAA